VRMRTVKVGPTHPALVEHAAATGLQDRVADGITAFAGSMWFVYLHAVWFAVWILCAVEDYPYGLLTMIVSLEAIFMATFVMISQNRADKKRQVIADLQWATIQVEAAQSQQILDLSMEIHSLTKAVHEHLAASDKGLS